MHKNEQPLILVAEDDPDDRFLLTEAFKANGFDGRLEFAKNGEEVINKAINLTVVPGKLPALILLDLNMPIKNGHEALVELKAHAVLNKVPVVILSTTDSKLETEKCLQLGAHAYIQKPNGYQELLQSVTALFKYIGYQQAI